MTEDMATAIRTIESRPDFARGAVNLGSPRLGARVMSVTDEFFAPAQRMLEDTAPIFYPMRYDTQGKWMDGWESRRRRDSGHDCCVIRLGAAGFLNGLELNTRFFTGNHPPHASIEGALSEDVPEDEAAWIEIVPRSSLKADSSNLFPVKTSQTFNHLRLNIYPDGGIARFRVWGRAIFTPGRDRTARRELSATGNGGRVIGQSDSHYGDPWVILTPGRGENMGDGWETRRRREPGHDWIVVALGAAGQPKRIEVDTAHFRGNYPEACSIQAAMLPGVKDEVAVAGSVDWAELMARHSLQMDRIHTFDADMLTDMGPVTHVRLNIHPDGGISRFRVFGTTDEGGAC